MHFSLNIHSYTSFCIVTIIFCSQGYLNRQALYACLTCIPEAKTDPTKYAGVCLACSLNCHEGHDLIELYTKRKFRCDCGNAKFGDFKCKLDEKKVDYNVSNSYNQNFSGVYCTCKRPYPDEEDTISDVMIQCIICEDWYHTRHLGVEIPSASYAEMICEGCVRQHEFLLHYDGLVVKKTSQESGEEVVEVTDTVETPKTENYLDVTSTVNDVSDKEEVPKELGDVLSKSQDVIAAITACKMPKQKSEVATKFYPDINWRQQLCTCVTCLKTYQDEDVLFLIDPQDSLQVYEEKGTAKALEEERTQEQKFLNSLDRVPLMETIAAYQELKGELAEFLKKFAENKKVVREEDVKEFFEDMKARKRQKTEIPYFCR